jgi:hypothetical protein
MGRRDLDAPRIERFVCRRAAELSDGTPAWIADDGDNALDVSVESRISALEAVAGTMQAAIAGLHARVNELEATR